MMPSSRSSVLMLLPLLGTVLLTGCASSGPKTPPPPPIVAATPDQEADLKAQITKTIPGAAVGHVSAADSSSSTAAILGIPLGTVHKGDSIQFEDSKLGQIANGTVIDENNDSPEYSFLIVRYEPTSNGRAPIKGDLAVHIPR
jgi:hypothetical protein